MPTEPSRQFMDYFPLAMTGGTVKTRGVGRYEPKHDFWPRCLEEIMGYKEYVEASGLKYRVMLWAPAGADEGEALDFDMLVEARQRGLWWLAGEPFETALRTLLAAGAEPVVYLGSPVADPDMAWRPEYPHQALAKLDRIRDSLAPLWRAGVTSIGLDYASNTPADSLPRAVVNLVRFLNPATGRVYVEPAPAPDQTDWFDKDFVILDWLWRQQQANGWIAKPGQLTGEIVRISDAEDNLPRGREVVADGHVFCSGAWWFQRRGVPLSALFERG